MTEMVKWYFSAQMMMAALTSIYLSFPFHVIKKNISKLIPFPSKRANDNSNFRGGFYVVLVVYFGLRLISSFYNADCRKNDVEALPETH